MHVVYTLLYCKWFSTFFSEIENEGQKQVLYFKTLKSLHSFCKLFTEIIWFFIVFHAYLFLIHSVLYPWEVTYVRLEGVLDYFSLSERVGSMKERCPLSVVRNIFIVGGFLYAFLRRLLLGLFLPPSFIQLLMRI